MDLSQKIKSVLFGVAIGDALGVPVEFMDRESLRRNPVTGMVGYGTYNQPPGTFSDDSSLTFCLAESLLQGFNLNTIGQSFVGWYYKNHWTARGSVFDVGNATKMAIQRLASGIQALQGWLDISFIYRGLKPTVIKTSLPAGRFNPFRVLIRKSPKDLNINHLR
jgi:ADP-ribosylglycohydrolase